MGLFSRDTTIDFLKLNDALKGGDAGKVRKLLNGKRMEGKDNALLRIDADIEMIRLLFEAGADPNYKAEDGNPPFFIQAVGKKRMDALEICLAHGADLSATGVGGETAFHMAARNNDTEMLKRLAAAGGDPSLRDNKNRSPLILAKELFRPAAIACLEELYRDRGLVKRETTLLFVGENGRVPEEGPTPFSKIVSRLVDDGSIPGGAYRITATGVSEKIDGLDKARRIYMQSMDELGERHHYLASEIGMLKLPDGDGGGFYVIGPRVAGSDSGFPYGEIQKDAFEKAILPKVRELVDGWDQMVKRVEIGRSSVTVTERRGMPKDKLLPLRKQIAEAFGDAGLRAAYEGFDEETRLMLASAWDPEGRDASRGLLPLTEENIKSYKRAGDFGKIAKALAASDPDIRHAAASALDGADAKYAKRLIGLLDDRDEDVRYAAMWSLGGMNCREAYDALLPLAGSTAVERDTAARALYAFGRLDFPEVLPILFGFAASADSTFRNFARAGLAAKLDKRWLEQSKDDDDDLLLPGKLGERRMAGPLLAALPELAGNARLNALKSLLVLEPDETLDLLADYCADPSPAVRAFAVATLSEAGRQVSRESMEAALRDPDPVVRKGALAALKGKADAGLAGPILALMNDADADVRKGALETAAFAAIPEFAELHEAAIADKKLFFKTREAACAALGITKAPGAFEALSSGLEDSDTRDACLEALGALGDPRAKPIVFSYLVHPYGHAGKCAAAALAALGDARFAEAYGPPFKEGENEYDRILSVKDPAIAALFAKELGARASEDLYRARLIEALGRSGIAGATETVRPYLEDTAHPKAAAAAAKALASLNDAGSIGAMLDMLMDDARVRDPDLRRNLVEALRKRADASWLPRLTAKMDYRRPDSAADAVSVIAAVDPAPVELLIKYIGWPGITRIRAASELARLGEKGWTDIVRWDYGRRISSIVADEMIACPDPRKVLAVRELFAVAGDKELYDALPLARLLPPEEARPCYARGLESASAGIFERGIDAAAADKSPEAFGVILDALGKRIAGEYGEKLKQAAIAGAAAQLGSGNEGRILAIADADIAAYPAYDGSKAAAGSEGKRYSGGAAILGDLPALGFDLAGLFSKGARPATKALILRTMTARGDRGPAIRLLERGVADPDARVQAQAIEGLVALGEGGLSAKIRPLTRSPDAKTAALAVEYLELDPEPADSALFARELAQKDEERVIRALGALSALGDAAGAEAARAMALDGHKKAQVPAAAYLAGIKDAAILPPLMERLANASWPWELRDALVNEIGRYGELCRERAVAWFAAAKDPQDKSFAARLLGKSGAKDHVPILIDLLCSEYAVRIGAAAALKDLGEPALGGAVTGDREDYLRLGRLGDKRIAGGMCKAFTECTERLDRIDLAKGLVALHKHGAQGLLPDSLVKVLRTPHQDSWSGSSSDCSTRTHSDNGGFDQGDLDF
jgi:HEAT repeat protein